MNLEVRSEVIEYGSLPMAPWLGSIDGLHQVRAVMLQLLQSASIDERGRGFVSPQAIAAALDTNAMQTKVLVDLLGALVEPPDLVQVPEGGEEACAVEVYSLGLYLVAQFYLREAHKADTADMWPSELFSMQQEPSSPVHMTAKAWGKDQSATHRAHLPMMRQHLQEHLVLQEALLQGFSGFLAKHARELLGLVLNPAPGEQLQQVPLQRPPPSPRQGVQAPQQLPQGGSPSGKQGEVGQPQQQQQQQQQQVSAAEVDRLGFLLRPPQPAQQREEGGGAARRIEGGSPMDVCCTPFTESSSRLGEYSSFFRPDGSGTAPLDAVAAWITESLRQDSDMADMAGGSPRAPSPGSSSVFNQLVSVSSLALPSDIQGVSKATVVRGEGDFPSASLRVLDCHDAVIYALAPLQYCLVSACSDCVVVVGAVGRAIRVERCERVQVIAAARCATINTCHDCIFYLGVNQRPTVLGDNRFLQLAPYNAGYERLQEHMAVAGVSAHPNLWDWPISLQPDHRKLHHEQLHEGPGAAGAAGAVGAQSPAAAGLVRGGSPGSPLLLPQEMALQPGPSPMVLSSASASASATPAAAAAGGGEGAGAAGGAVGEGAVAAEGEGEEVALPSPVLWAPASVTLLPPNKLLPFLVPFGGGPGPMCGGPSKVSINIRASSDSLSGFMAMGEGSATFPSSPFGLPAAYVQAWEAKMKSAAEVRMAVKTANLDEGKKKELMSAIQAHFKDWLQQTGGMRQVYDLARMERERDDAAGGGGSGSGSSSGGPSQMATL